MAEMSVSNSAVRIIQDNRQLFTDVDIAHILNYYNSFEPKETDLEGRISESGLKAEFFKHLMENPSRALIQRFKDCLTRAGMTKLYNLLDKKEVQDERVFSELVIKNSRTMNRLNWDSILSYYYGKGIIELLHKKILKEACDVFKWTSVICYFSTMDGWFFTFLKCLKELKEHEAIQSLSPLFLEAKSDESLRKIVDEFIYKDGGGIPEETRMSLKVNPEENEAFFRYLKWLGNPLNAVDIHPVVRCLYVWKCLSNSEKHIILNQNGSFYKILSLTKHLISKKDSEFYIIRALQECKETSALEALGFDPEDDEIDIHKKIAHIKDMGQEMNSDNQKERPTKEDAKAFQSAGGELNSHQQNEADAHEETGSGRSELETDAAVETKESSCYSFKADDEESDEDQHSKREEVRNTPSDTPSETILNPNKLQIKGLAKCDANSPSMMEAYQALEPLMDMIEIGPHGKKSIEIKDGIVTVEFKNPDHAAFSMDILQEGALDVSYVEEMVTTKAFNNSCSAESFGSQYKRGRPSSATPVATDFELRGYQKELAEQALTGRNCIIVAPTGSGKTHVAIHIIKEHLKTGNRKVVFVVPTVALVEQQKKQMQKHCNERVIGLSGSSDLSLDNLMNSADMFVLTPQILLNQLDSDEDFLRKLSLIVFDECHHTNKDHPYNTIMSNYLSIRHNDRNAQLPQIVGLTASIGVGKAKTMKDAVDHVMQICANLDSLAICVVSKNLKELAQHSNKPNEETMELDGRADDPFDKAVNKIMADIEKQMIDSPERINAEKETKNFTKDLKLQPSERGYDPYIQWLSRIRKAACTIHRQNTRMFYITLIDYLIMYNNSLMINADCRTKDALNYIELKIEKEDYSSLPLPEGLNDSLVNQWKTISQYLSSVANDPKFDNPKLEKMKLMISDYYKENSDSRCIIFCKTREMATALVNWMNETPELQPLNPTKLVGTNAPANREGMTSVQQDDVLKYFRDGEHKVIVATSVAEEGLDVQKCNIVIRYEHVTNSIARVQTRGRARKDNAKYVLVAEKGRGASEKEEKNAIREEMMKKAIAEFQSLGYQERKNSIHKLQREALVSRKWSGHGKRASNDLRGNHLDGQEFELRCIKCDQLAAMSYDIKKIQDSHHVIIDPAIRDRIEIRPHPKSKELSKDFAKTGKIYCSKCKMDWGIMALYKNVPFPVIKVNSFVVKSGASQSSYKQWKQVPFPVKSLTLDDLKVSEAQSFPGPSDDWNKLFFEDESCMDSMSKKKIVFRCRTIDSQCFFVVVN